MAPTYRAAALLAALAIGACASAPVTLVALPPAPAPEMRDAGPGPTILLRNVTVPGYLDSFPVVVGRKGSALAVSDSSEWAERPSLGVARVLRDALSQRLDAARVLIEGDGRIPDADLTVEFLALDPQEAVLHLDARWSFSCTAARGSLGGRTQLQVPMAGAMPTAVAAATTEALARLADVLSVNVPCVDRPYSDRMPTVR